MTKGALTGYGKLTWESAHAWNLILYLLIAWGMTFIFMVHLSFYAIPLLIYDVMYVIATTPYYPVIIISKVIDIYHVRGAEMFYEIMISLISSLKQ